MGVYPSETCKYFAVLSRAISSAQIFELVIREGKNWDASLKFEKMAVTRKQAEGYWNKYNKDGNDELTKEEVKACLQEVYESVDDQDINVSIRISVN